MKYSLRMREFPRAEQKRKYKEGDVREMMRKERVKAR